MAGAAPRQLQYAAGPRAGAQAQAQQQLYGVPYEGGLPKCGYAHSARADASWNDPRHVDPWLQHVLDPVALLGFAQARPAFQTPR